MDYILIRRLLVEKLKDRGTYTLAFVVGTLINSYGQLLVPWFRSDTNPFTQFAEELSLRPGLTVFSVFIAYAFPLCVSTYSVVVSRYRNRRMESISDFPDKKPDPVFRATRDGQIVEVGAETQVLFDKHNIKQAQAIIGNILWDELCSPEHHAEGCSVYFQPEDVHYLVRCSPTAENQINVYMAQLPKI